MRVDGVKQPVAFYSLDVILSVGYRVNSQRGIAFRKWVNSVLKKYIIQGYAVNEKRLTALQKTVENQSKNARQHSGSGRRGCIKSSKSIYKCINTVGSV